jgi:phosphate transport system protein
MAASFFVTNMAQTFELQLGKIRNRLIDMGRLAEENLILALSALAERDPAKSDAVEQRDDVIDNMEVEIDEMLVTYMATHGPIASDCRLMLVASKITTNLERIGDLSVTIARRSRELTKEPVFQPFSEIQRMGDMAVLMVRDSIACFVSGEYDLATGIIKRDKEIDAAKRELIHQLTTIMVSDSLMITRAMKLIEVTRTLERIADHAKNIAEEVYYLIQAEDIRHTDRSQSGT